MEIRHHIKSNNELLGKRLPPTTRGDIEDVAAQGATD
jgi:hypothetical protein